MAKKTKVKKTKKVEQVIEQVVPAIKVEPVPLTDVEKFYIEGKVASGVSTTDIAASLKRDEKEILEFVESFKATEDSNFQKALARRSQNGNTPGISMMTLAASEQGDEARKTQVKVPMKYTNCVTNIKKKK